MLTKFRNRLIALCCFLLFIGIGTAFLWNSSFQKPFGIILFIGDGMAPSLLTATRLYEGGADHRLALEDFPQCALTRTYGNDFAVPDAASAATALATGQRVNHQSLAMFNGHPLPSLMEEASLKDRAVGLISNGSLTGATAAAFYAKSLNAQDEASNALQLTDHAPINLLLGGGRKNFIPPRQESHKKTSNAASSLSETDLLKKISNKEITVVKTMEELAAIPSWKSAPIIGLLADDTFDFHNETSSDSNQPSLGTLVQQSIQRLQHYRHGYLLIVDDALIAKAATLNNGEQLFHEISEFDKAIAIAHQYAGSNALILVTGKQNLGGMRMNGTPFRNDKGVGVLGINAQGVPSITWSTGPGHNTPSSSDGSKEPASILAEPAAFLTPTTLGIAEDTITMAIGPGSEPVHGFIDLTTIHDLIKKQL